MNILKKAEQIAREAHKGQKRKDGKPYITHPEAVANSKSLKFVQPDHQVVAWLHDILEDTDLKPEDLEKKGIPRRLVKSIIHITRIKGENYKDYILKVKKDGIARNVKIEDLKHNLSNLEKGSMRDKYLLALYILEGDDEEEENECKYCGKPNNSSDEDMLCEECRETFGHACYSEL